LLQEGKHDLDGRGDQWRRVQGLQPCPDPYQVKISTDNLQQYGVLHGRRIEAPADDVLSRGARCIDRIRELCRQPHAGEANRSSANRGRAGLAQRGHRG
jgi:hypothetical protein